MVTRREKHLFSPHLNGMDFTQQNTYKSHGPSPHRRLNKVYPFKVFSSFAGVSRRAHKAFPVYMYCTSSFVKKQMLKVFRVYSVNPKRSSVWSEWRQSQICAIFRNACHSENILRYCQLGCPDKKRAIRDRTPQACTLLIDPMTTKGLCSNKSYGRGITNQLDQVFQCKR